mgnify:CR=1 FL=1
MKIKKDEVGWLLLFIAPTLILFTLFFILPILFLLASSFTNWDGIDAEFVGFENYIKLFNKKIHCTKYDLKNITLGLHI